MATFKAIVFDNHLKLDGSTNIKIRIYHNKSTQYISTPYYITPEDMGRDGNILPSCPDSDLYNYEIGNLIQKYRAVCLRLGSDRVARMSCIEVKEFILASMEPKYEYIDFIEFANSVIESTEKEGTAEWYRTAIRSLCWFYGREKIDVRDVTGTRMNEFAEALSEKGICGKGLEPGAVSNYLRAIRSLFNKAKKKYNNEDYDIIRISNNPFAKVKIPRYRRKRKSLSVLDIKRIRDGN